MNVKNPNLVLVRGINSDWFEKNFKEFWIGFGGSPKAVPLEDSYYVGLYLEAPVSAITHIGIVAKIERHDDNNVDFYLNSILKLQNPVQPGHAIRKHENWTLTRLGLDPVVMENLRIQLSNF